MLWDKKNNLMAEGFTADILAMNEFDCICVYYPENTEITFSTVGLSVPNEEAYSYYFPSNSTAVEYSDFTIKIRQTFGKEFTFIVFFSMYGNNGGKIDIGPYGDGCFYSTLPRKLGVQWLNNKDNKEYSMKAGEIYMYVCRIHWNSGTKEYLYDVFLYDYLSKKNMLYTLNLSTSIVVENPMNVSNKIPGLRIATVNNDEYDTNVTFYGLRAYSCYLTESEILECLDAHIYFNKSPSQLRAKKFNEYPKYNGNVTIENDENTHEYRNTTFRKDGTVCCSGQLIEGATNQICKNGDIKCQEFIEY